MQARRTDFSRESAMLDDEMHRRAEVLPAKAGPSGWSACKFAMAYEHIFTKKFTTDNDLYLLSYSHLARIASPCALRSPAVS